ENLEFAGFTWNVNPDEQRYRRGLYTHWKRAALYPSFAIFDSPNRTSACARRISSTTPLQALVTLNDPVFFEAAVHLGRRMLEECREPFEFLSRSVGGDEAGQAASASDRPIS